MKTTIVALIISSSLLGGRLLAIEGETLGTSCAKIAAGAPETLTYISLTTVGQKEGGGTITAVGNPTITDGSAGWTAGQYDGGTHYVELTSGPAAGAHATILSNTADTLTLDTDPSGIATPGSGYCIRRFATLDSVFANAIDPSGATGLKSATNSTDADNVLLVTPGSGGAVDTYFFDTTPGSEGWKDGAAAPAGDTTIMPEQGIIIRRKVASDVRIYLSGALKSGQLIVPIGENYSLVGSLKISTDITLDASGLWTGDTLTGVASGENPTDADNVLVINPDGSLSRYFYLDFGGTTGWHDVNYQPAGSTTIKAGAAFYILRNATGGFNWTIPAE